LQTTDLGDSEIEREINFSTNGAWIAVSMGAVVFVVGIIFLGGIDDANYNRIGDFIGGIVGSIWSLAGLMFLYAAFLSQKEELRLTKEEFQAHTEEFKKQNNTIQRQSFESTFLNLLEIHRKSIKDIGEMNTPASNFPVKGQEVVARTVKNIEFYLNEELKKDPKFDWKGVPAWVVIERELKNNLKNQFQIFQNLEFTMNYISERAGSSKLMYHKLFSAQMSRAERMLYVFYLYRWDFPLLFNFWDFGYVQDLNTNDPDSFDDWPVKFIRYAIWVEKESKNISLKDFIQVEEE